ncbi:MAG TPA: DUF1697 domain-containing protein [Thermoleophilia bacterium]|nr:DUF1697 domain-containing protein [Thermoleophilia bacterium]
MGTYAAPLRGVNVGGRSVPVASLREGLAEGGFANVRTYLQSGIIVIERGASGRRRPLARRRTPNWRTVRTLDDREPDRSRIGEGGPYGSTPDLVGEEE